MTYTHSLFTLPADARILSPMRNPKKSSRKLSTPCPTQYASDHFKGKHNTVPIMSDTADADGMVRSTGKRCVSCGAQS